MEKQTNVKSHLFCFMSFVILSSVTHPPFAVLLLWDLYLGPQQPPQSLPALLLHLQPEARLGELLLLPERKKKKIRSVEITVILYTHVNVLGSLVFCTHCS